MKNRLNDICEITCDTPIFNTYKLNSIAKIVANVKTIDELKNVLNILNEENEKYLVLGGASNVILPKYYDGVVIKLIGFNKMTNDNGKIYVEANYMLNKLSMELSKEGYTGLEWASGIPGSIGGSIYNNAGAYKFEIKDVLTKVTVLENDEIKELTLEEMKFAYRTSIFKENKNMIILSCEMKLEKSNVEEIMATINERKEKRLQSQPLDMPSCGSVFRNPEGLVAGKLIDDLGLKGYKIGGAKISEKHANFIVNAGDATYEDVISLIEFIKEKVKIEYNIDLILEQEIIK